MSRSQSWIVLIFIINTYFVVVTEETNNPLKRPWLDLNLDPEDLDEPPEEDILADPNLETSTQIPGGRSSNDDAKRQHDMEWWFVNNGKVWNELWSDPEPQDEKWRIICDEMIKEWKKELALLQGLLCQSARYKTNGLRRLIFKQLKERRRGQKAYLVPDVLLCNCTYFYVNPDNILLEKKEYFAVKHFKENEYFLLEKKLHMRSHTYWVSSIHTLDLSS